VGLRHRLKHKFCSFNRYLDAQAQRMLAPPIATNHAQEVTPRGCAEIGHKGIAPRARALSGIHRRPVLGQSLAQTFARQGQFKVGA
jgi:hypothetical protein